MSATIRCGRRSIAVSHPDKIMFPEAGLSKLDLARHYERVGALMKPLLRNRPLTFQVFPDGVGSEGFYMKSVPKHFPDWIARTRVAKRGGSLTQVVGADAATLVYLAGQNMVTPHAWLSRADRPREPDRLIVDFDPSPGAGFAAVRAAARAAGDRLRDAGLVPYAMVTGSRGIHVVCPLRRGNDFGVVHGWARALAEAMIADDPRHLTLEWRKADRGERIYVDVNRINYAQHAVAPYGVRARARAPVAMPIAWDELTDRTLRPDRWTIETCGERIDWAGDPWRGFGRRARSLPDAPGG
jgi:bifunctional non-homologous end joining protein LigD